jgi:hypothetical protein
VPSPPGEERASAFLMPNDWGEGGVKSPYLRASTISAANRRNLSKLYGV